MDAEENLERDREFVREFEARIETGLAKGRAALGRYTFRCSLVVAALYAVLAAFDRLLHFGVAGNVGIAIGGMVGTAAARSGLDDTRRRAGERLQAARDPRLAGVLARYAS